MIGLPQVQQVGLSANAPKLGGFFCPGELKLPPPKDHPVFLDWGDNLPDMTAIAIVHTPDGFVIGADGLRQILRGPTIDGQKLFRFEEGNVYLGYAWCGNTVIWDDDDPDTIYFDFRSSTAPILKEICSKNYVDWVGFIHCFRALLQIQIDQSTKARNWVAEFEDKSIARMLLAGYVKGDPVLVQIEIKRIDSERCVSAGWLPLPKSLLPFSCCSDITMDNGLERTVENSKDGQSVIHEYMERSASNPNCEGLFGKGTILVAKITPNSFTWLDGPIEDES
jgi:hypothetical protein